MPTTSDAVACLANLRQAGAWGGGVVGGEGQQVVEAAPVADLHRGAAPPALGVDQAGFGVGLQVADHSLHGAVDPPPLVQAPGPVHAHPYEEQDEVVVRAGGGAPAFDVLHLLHRGVSLCSARQRSSRRRILPLADRGSAARNSTARTFLYGATAAALSTMRSAE